MIRIFIFIFSGLFTTSIFAQEVEVIKNENVTIHVGIDDFSMLNILNRSILHVDVNSEKCEIESERSLRVGKLVFKPKGTENFTMFVTDNYNDTYTINVNVNKLKPPELFTIRNKKAELEEDEIRSAKSKYQKSTVKIINISSDRKQASLDLILSMALNEEPKNTDVILVNKEVMIWNEVRLFKRKIYRVGTLEGFVYEIENITNAKMVFNEAEFEVINDQTVAVAIEHPVLLPSKKTFIYIVVTK